MIGTEASKDERRGWNLRYLMYARSHGVGPRTMLAHDRRRWPGGVMAGFIIWMGDQWTRWAQVTNHPKALNRYAYISKEDHRSFDRWLMEGRCLSG